MTLSPNFARLRRSCSLSLATVGLVGFALTGCAATVRYAPHAGLARHAASESVGSEVVAGPAVGGVSVAMERRDAMMEEVEQWMGTPYRHGREEMGRGTDCSGFTSQVYLHVLGLRLPRNSGEQYGRGTAIDRTQLEFGDLVFFGSARGRVSHVGMYVGDGKFAHASSSRGVVIDELAESYFAARYLGARRYGLDASEWLDPADVQPTVQLGVRMPADPLGVTDGLIDDGF